VYQQKFKKEQHANARQRTLSAMLLVTAAQPMSTTSHKQWVCVPPV
jgi:hypothetical protein